MFNPVCIKSENDYDEKTKSYSLEIIINFERILGRLTDAFIFDGHQTLHLKYTMHYLYYLKRP